MSVNRIAVRYAKSLIELAIEQKKLEEVFQDMKSFREVLRNRDFQLLLRSPIIHADKKIKVFDALFKDQLTELTTFFFRIIIKKGREAHLQEISGDFMRQYNEIKKISHVKLTTAVSVDQKKQDLIKERIRESGITYPNIELETIVNPNIIGGFVLEFEDKLYDASVLNHLERLKKEFS